MRGMLAGLIAGLLSFGFLRGYGEPAIDRAIAFENAMDAAKAKAKAEEMAAKGMVTPKEEPDDLKALYATAFEIEPQWLIRAAARRQKWSIRGSR